MEIFSNLDTNLEELEVRQKLFNKDAHEYLNKNSTESFRFIEKVFVLDNVFADFFNTGLLRISRKGHSTQIFTFNNCNILLENENLEKLLKIVDVAAEKIEVKENRQITLDFSDAMTVDTFSIIINNEELSDLEKIGAIVSLQHLCPKLPAEKVTEIALCQKEIADGATIPISRLIYFLTPGFSISESEVSGRFMLRGTAEPDVFMQYISYVRFLTQAEPNETYSEYLENNSENLFEPTVFHSEYYGRDAIAMKAAQSGQTPLWIQGKDGLLNDLTADQAARFLPQSYVMTKTSANLLKERIKSGVKLAYEDDLWQRKVAESGQHKKLICLAKFLTTQEIYEIFGSSQYSQNSLLSNMQLYLSKFSATILARYYLQSGIEKLTELIKVIENDPAYAGFWSEPNETLILENASNREVTFEMFMQVLDPEYADYPIDWALALITESNLVKA